MTLAYQENLLSDIKAQYESHQFFYRESIGSLDKAATRGAVKANENGQSHDQSVCCADAQAKERLEKPQQSSEKQINGFDRKHETPIKQKEAKNIVKVWKECHEEDFFVRKQCTTALDTEKKETNNKTLTHYKSALGRIKEKKKQYREIFNEINSTAAAEGKVDRNRHKNEIILMEKEKKQFRINLKQEFTLKIGKLETDKIHLVARGKALEAGRDELAEKYELKLKCLKKELAEKYELKLRHLKNKMTTKFSGKTNQFVEEISQAQKNAAAFEKHSTRMESINKKLVVKVNTLQENLVKTEQLQYFADNAMELKNKMQRHGAVIFRNFDLMKEQDGFQQMYGALGMNVCLDPLHSVSARPTVDGKKNSPVYEAVNKESRKNFFIGMHNEFVGTRAPRAAAFCCFKAAEVGGEFLVADGRRIFTDLKPDIVEELHQRGIRYSVTELPFFGWVYNLPEMIQPAVMSGLKTAASTAINAKVDFNVDLRWDEGGYDSVKMLQARAPSQPAIVLHPTTGEPTWFCNVHSHSAKLRKDRESKYGAERFEDGASQINKSDMFYGDDGNINDDVLDHLDEVTIKNLKSVKMSEGDVVLLDNYKCMHGRDVFDGTRKHGVAWFEGWEGEETQIQNKESIIRVDAASSSSSSAIGSASNPLMGFFENMMQQVQK